MPQTRCGTTAGSTCRSRSAEPTTTAPPGGGDAALKLTSAGAKSLNRAAKGAPFDAGDTYAKDTSGCRRRLPQGGEDVAAQRWSQARVDRLRLEREDGEHRLVHAPERLAAREPLERLEPERVLAQGE